jgi:high-affinity iron transporter
MLPTFVIFLREGIEASMIVAILLSYLKRMEQRRHFRDVFLGVGAAFGLIFAGGIAAYLLISRYSGSRVQTYFETATYLLAAAVLTYMTFWMQGHARSLSYDLHKKSDEARSHGKRWGLGLLSFQAVAREGVETMVFTLAIIFANTKQGPIQASAGSAGQSGALWLGAILGIAVSLAIAFYIYKLGAKINLRRFFQVLGVLLMVFAAGLLADVIQNMQELNWLPFGHNQLWNSSRIVAENSNIGDALHSFLGYADRPSILQALVWATYIVSGISLFMYLGRKKKPKSA